MDFKINGRKVKSGEVGKALEREFGEKIAAVAKDQVVQAVGAVRCPVHGGTPGNVTMSGPSKLNTAQRITATYCCDKQREAVEAELRS